MLEVHTWQQGPPSGLVGVSHFCLKRSSAKFATSKGEGARSVPFAHVWGCKLLLGQWAEFAECTYVSALLGARSRSPVLLVLALGLLRAPLLLLQRFGRLELFRTSKFMLADFVSDELRLCRIKGLQMGRLRLIPFVQSAQPFLPLPVRRIVVTFCLQLPTETL